jgi:hypothetical protein
MSGGPQFNASGVDLATANVEHDPRERTAWWPCSRSPGSKVEATLMTWTVQHALLGPWDDGARKVRAFLAVGDELGLGCANEDAGVVLVGIAEDDGTAHGHVVD